MCLALTCAWVLLPGAQAAEREWKGGKWVKLAEPAEGTPAGELALVRRHLEDGKHKRAVKAAEEFLKRYPDDKRREEVMFLAARAQYSREHYWQAYEWLEIMLSNYPGGEFFERGLKLEMDVAEAFLAGKKRIVAKIFRMPAVDEGLEILARVAEHAPGTVLAEKALLRIGDHHYSRGDYEEAADAYDYYVEVFPKTKRTPYAMLQAARSMRASFRGTKYDETPLIDAEERYRQFARQYPAQAKKENVTRILRGIAVIRAEKLHGEGRFYERTGKKKAAVFYYRQVVDNYPDTTWAKAARDRLRRLGALVGPPPVGTPAGASSQPGAANGPAPDGAKRETPATQPAKEADE